jgi:murein L,D-transpeptidase YcbB/YkuD
MWKRFLLSVLATVTLSVLDITAVDASIRARIEPLGRTALTIEGRRIIATRSLAELYAMNDYRPYWDELRLNSLLTAIESLHDDGLEPEDYHYSALRSLIERGNPDAATREALDILASDAYALALYHLARGKVDPVSLNPHWNFAARDIRGLESTTFIRDAIVSNRILSSLEEIRQQDWLYAAGRDAQASVAQRFSPASGSGHPTLVPAAGGPRAPDAGSADNSFAAVGGGWGAITKVLGAAPGSRSLCRKKKSRGQPHDPDRGRAHS